MAKIPLAQRTQLPPARVGAVKPPVSLADDTLAQAGAIGAKFAGAVQSKLVQSKAAEEQAVFEGEINTEIEKYKTFVTANPGAGFDVLQKERDRMMAKLEVAGQKATTGIGKRANANFFAREKNLIFAKTQTQMQAIKSNQILATYREIQQNNVARFDKVAYEKAKDNMIASGMLDKKFADAIQVQDFAVIDKAQSIKLSDDKMDLVFGQALQFVEEGGLKGIDEDTAIEFINASTILDQGEKAKVRQQLRAEKAALDRSRERQEQEAQTSNLSRLFIDISTGERSGAEIQRDIIRQVEVNILGVQGLTTAQASTLTTMLGNEPGQVTTIAEELGIRRLIQRAKLGLVTEDVATNLLALEAQNIDPADASQFMGQLFSAFEKSTDSKQTVLNQSVARHVNLLRRSITAPDPFGLLESSAIKQELAARAELELFQHLGDEFDEKDIKQHTDDLIRKYNLTQSGFIAAQAEKDFLAATSAAEQAKAVRDAITALEKAGDSAKAQEIQEEAFRLGILTREGKPKAGKETKSNIGRLIDALRRQ